MNTASDTADLIVKEGIQITESTIKLAGSGAKNLIALLIALSQDNQKLMGKTNLQRLIKEGKELKLFQLKSEDLEKFHSNAKKYGVLYTVIIDKDSNDKICDIVAKAEDVAKLNYIFEKMHYPLPKITEGKKDLTRVLPLENESKEHENILKNDNEKTISVKDKIEEIKNNNSEKVVIKEVAITQTISNNEKTDRVH